MTIARGPAQLYDIKGSADQPYRVVLPYDTAIEATCTCPAFFYKTAAAKVGGGCKHIDRVRAQNGGFEYQDGDVVVPSPVVDRSAAPGGIVELLEDAFTRGMELGRKFGALYGKAER